MIRVTKTRDRSRENTWRLRWTNSGRKSISWKGDEGNAETARSHIEHLINRSLKQQPPHESTADWVDALSESDHRKLVGVGSIQSRSENKSTLTVEWLVNQFCDAQKSVTKGTRETYKQAKTSLIAYFSAERVITSITRGEARSFREWLATEGNQKETSRKSLGDNTVRRRIGICRQVFNFAVDSEWLTRNPFKGIPASVHSNPERLYYVTPDEFSKAIDKAPDTSWRALIALNRMIGLRVPSEIQALKWSDIDLPNGEIHIRSKKTKRDVKRRGLRTVPIFEQLRPYLEDLWEIAEPGTKCGLNDPVFPRYIDKSEAAMRTKYRRILELAGIEPWPSIFTNGRKSAITDLLNVGYDVTDVANWVGNSPQIIWQYYAMSKDAQRRRTAAGVKPLVPSKTCGPICGPMGGEVTVRHGKSAAATIKETPIIAVPVTGGDSIPWAILDSNQ